MLDIENTLVKVAWYYFMNNMTQQQIAETLGIPRMRVVKLLSQAKDEGIVQFKINQSIEKKIGIENSLMDKYGLDDAVVVPRTSPEQVTESVSLAAALYIDEKAKDGDFINIGFGQTVSTTVSKLTYNTEKKLSFVSLTGGVSHYTSTIIKGAHYRPSSKVTPDIHIIPAPLLASSRETAEAFLGERSISDVFSMNKLAHMTVIGIGALQPNASIFKLNIASEHDFQLMKMNGAVGDLLSNFIDASGNRIETDMHDRLISTPIERLREFRNTIAVAGGDEKKDAIKAALLGGYVNVLITDESTAHLLIES